MTDFVNLTTVNLTAVNDQAKEPFVNDAADNQEDRSMSEVPVASAPVDQAQRLADLRASRQVARASAASQAGDSKGQSSSSLKRRATLGKIFATGFTSTTVFGLTAALGLSSNQGSSEPSVVAPTQYVLDVTTGQLVTYTNGQPTAVTQVMGAAASGQTVAAQGGAIPPDLSGLGQLAPAAAPLPGNQPAAVGSVTQSVVAPPVGASEIGVVVQSPQSPISAEQTLVAPDAGPETPAIVPVVAPVIAPVVEAIPIAIPTPATTIPAPQGSSSGTK